MAALSALDLACLLTIHLSGLFWIASSCNREAMLQCYDGLVRLPTFRQMDNETIFPWWNDTDLDFLCRTMEEAKSCADNVTIYCSSAENIVFVGTNSAIFFVCGEGLEEYKRVKDCYTKDEISRRGMACHEAYLTNLKSIEIDTNLLHEAKRSKLCSVIDQSIECLREETKQICDESAANWLATVMSFNHVPAKNEIECHEIRSDHFRPSPPLIFGILLGVLLLTPVLVLCALLCYRRHRLEQQLNHSNSVKYQTSTVKNSYDQCHLLPSSAVPLMRDDRTNEPSGLTATTAVSVKMSHNGSTQAPTLHPLDSRVNLKENGATTIEINNV